MSGTVIYFTLVMSMSCARYSSLLHFGHVNALHKVQFSASLWSYQCPVSGTVIYFTLVMPMPCARYSSPFTLVMPMPCIRYSSLLHFGHANALCQVKFSTSLWSCQCPASGTVLCFTLVMPMPCIRYSSLLHFGHANALHQVQFSTSILDMSINPADRFL